MEWQEWSGKTGSVRFAASLSTQVAPHSARACEQGAGARAQRHSTRAHQHATCGVTLGQHQWTDAVRVARLHARPQGRASACTCSQLCKRTSVHCVGQRAASARTHARASTHQRALGDRWEGPLGRLMSGKAPPVSPQRWLDPPIQIAQPNRRPVDVGGLLSHRVSMYMGSL